MSEDITHAKRLISYHFPMIPTYHGHLSAYQACERQNIKKHKQFQALEETTRLGMAPQKGSSSNRSYVNSLAWQEVIMLKIKDLMLQGKQKRLH